MNLYKFGAPLLLMGAMALPALADDTYYDSARVIAVTPHVERINMPRQECRADYSRESYSYPSYERSPAGAIIGGVAGGIIGNQVGRGGGRVVATAIGAVTGAIVGDHIDNDHQGGRYYGERPVERCTVVDDWQTVTRGYQVTYRYNGRDYTTMMPSDPGNTVNIRVSIAPEIGSNVSYLEPGYRQHRRWAR